MSKPILFGVLALAFISCNGRELGEKDERIKQLITENSALTAKVDDLQKRLDAELERPDRVLARAQSAFASGDYKAAAELGEHLVETHPAASEAKTASQLVARARAKVAEETRRVQREAERQRKKEIAQSAAAEQEQHRRVRADLNKNLNGAGGGFVRRWEWSGGTFTLVIDESMYQPNAASAAAMTARAIFEMDGVPLPSTLVFRSASGNLLDSGPFANVPSLSGAATDLDRQR